MRSKKTLRAPALAAVVIAAGACGLLEVDNPNSLVEEDIQSEAAASAVANGALARVSRGISEVWLPYHVASDEMSWTGSRDGWNQLDLGFVANPENEFTDATFGTLAQARWLADEAIEILEGHVAEKPGNSSFKLHLARANLFAGIAYTVIGEIQQDYTFSDKLEAGAAVGEANMYQVLEQAVEKLTNSITLARELGDSDLEIKATAARARARQARAIWDKLYPAASAGEAGLVSPAGAVADALAVIGMAGGVTADWSYGFAFSANSVSNYMAGEVNNRKENQLETTLVTRSAASDVTGVALNDPIDDVIDPVVTWKIEKWKGGQVTDPGNQYAPLDFVSTRMMHLIAAEDALAKGDDAGFATHINHVRAMDGLSPYSGQIPAMDILRHERRVNLMLMGVRLGDMYRFGVVDPRWSPTAEAVLSPGIRFPITITELRANCNLNGVGC
jgi:hypothetical protein